LRRAWVWLALAACGPGAAEPRDRGATTGEESAGSPRQEGPRPESAENAGSQNIEPQTAEPQTADPQTAGPHSARPENPRPENPRPEPSNAPDDSLESLSARLSPVHVRPGPSLQASVEACPPPTGTGDDAFLDWYEACGIGSALMHSRDGARWVGLAVDFSEGGPEGFVLWERRGRRERELLHGEVDPANVARLLQHAGRTTRLVTARSLVRATATTYYSLNEYPALVELGPPLEAWRVWLETTDDLDRPEWVLWLFAPDGARHELARREAEVGPCDGGGWWCEETGDECDAAGLRAENRLCVLPASVTLVALAGRHLGILGGVQVAGHGGYPPFHWITALPDAVQP